MKRLLWLPAIAGVLLLSSTVAGAASPAPKPDESTASVPPLVYRSPFEGYRLMGEDKRGKWLEVNDAVRSKSSMSGMNGNDAPAAKDTAPSPDATPAKIAPAPQHQHQSGG